MRVNGWCIVESHCLIEPMLGKIVEAPRRCALRHAAGNARAYRAADRLAVTLCLAAVAMAGHAFAHQAGEAVTPGASPAPMSGTAPLPPKAAVVPAAASPRIPYLLIGVLRLGGRWSVLLATNAKHELATTGDVLDRKWLVEAIDEQGIRFKFLPLGTMHHLAFSTATTPDEAPMMATSTGGRSASLLAAAITAPVPGSRVAQAGHAPGKSGNDDGSGEALSAAPPIFQRRIASADIPREPWVCQAARMNALVTCRNTWSMSDDERMVCRQVVDQRYNQCLSNALNAPAQPVQD